MTFPDDIALGPGSAWIHDPILSGLDPDMFDLVSVDAFDTLVMRATADPADVFLTIARRGRALGLLDTGVSDPLFATLRRNAEQAARAETFAHHGHTEVSLADIYQAMPSALVDAEGMMAVEQDEEAGATFPNPFLLSWLHHMRRRGTPLVLLSDMYLGQAGLTMLLERHGIAPELFTRIWVSSDQGCSKAEGGLFAKLLEAFPEVPPSRILHIGDDPTGDVSGARSRGLRAVHYAPGPELSRLQARECSVAGGPPSLQPHLPLRRLVAILGRNDPDDDAFWTSYGSLVVGPAIAEYCAWVVEDCGRRGIRHILPLMREGRIFAPLMRRYAAKRGIPVTVEPLWVSRQALARLDPVELNDERLRDLLERRPHLSWERLCGLVGTPGMPGRLANLVGLSFEGLLAATLPDGTPALDAVLDYLNSPTVRAHRAAAASEARILTLEYLKERLKGVQRAALVDLGARATTAAAIADIPELAAECTFRAYLLYAVPELAGNLRRGLPVSVFAAGTPGGLVMGKVLYRSPQVLERLLTGLDTTTVGYRHTADGRIEPEADPSVAEGEEQRAISLAQAGIARYWICRELVMDAVAPRPDGTLPSDRHSVDGETALFPIFAAVQAPRTEEMEHLVRLRYDYNDGSEEERGICDAAALDAARPLLELGDGPLAALAAGIRPMALPWPQGALALLDAPGLRRHYDATAVTLSHDAFCQGFASSLRRRGIDRLAIYAVGGTSGMGTAFIAAARQENIAITVYADGMPHLLDGPVFCGVPVASAADLPSSGCGDIALVTLGYRTRLVEEMRRACAGSLHRPHLWSYGISGLTEEPL